MKKNTLIANLDEDKYHSSPELSKHQLDNFRRAPSYYKAKKEEPDISTAALSYGRLFHCAILEPDELCKRFYVMPQCDKRTKEGKAIFAEAELAAAGRELVKEDDFRDAQHMERAMMKNSVIKGLLDEKKQMHREASLFWTDEKTGNECRSRLDILRNDEIIIDLKTCQDADIRSFSRACFNFNYDRQAYFYSKAAETTISGYNPRAFVFIVIEKEPPFLCAAYTAPPEMMALGRQTIREDLQFFAECKKKDSWPGLREIVQDIEVPEWEKKKLQ